MVVRRLPGRPLPEPVWNPSLDDTELDSLSVRLRAAIRAALPELVKSEQRGMGAPRHRHFETMSQSNLAVRLEAARMRSVVRNRRPVLEVRFHGAVRSPDPRTAQEVSLPVVGECRLDINSGAIVHLSF